MAEKGTEQENKWTRNNIFQFATHELSQDAFFAWLINGWNTPKNRKKEENKHARHVAYEFLKLLYDGAELLPESEIDDRICILRQHDKIDVLVLFKRVNTSFEQSYALIIEDKTTTGEHDHQIARYRDALTQKQQFNNWSNQEIAISSERIHVAYVKVDYWNDFDKSLVGEQPFGDKSNSDSDTHKIDITPVKAGDLQRFLERKDLQIQSYVAKSYLEHLNIDYVKPNQIANVSDNPFPFDDGEFSSAAEYGLLRALFPKRHHKIAQGTSYGRPWNNLNVWQKEVEIPFSDKKFGNLTAIITRNLFWRVDTNYVKKDSDNPDSHYKKYLSLRQYENPKDIYLSKSDMDKLSKLGKQRPKLPAMPGGKNDQINNPNADNKLVSEAKKKIDVFKYMQNELNAERKNGSETFDNKHGAKGTSIEQQTKDNFNQLISGSRLHTMTIDEAYKVARNFVTEKINGQSAKGENHESELVHIQLNSYDKSHKDRDWEKLCAGVYYITARAQALAEAGWTSDK